MKYLVAGNLVKAQRRKIQSFNTVSNHTDGEKVTSSWEVPTFIFNDNFLLQSKVKTTNVFKIQIADFIF